ncbi:MAG: sulfatase-like hydrolase/transferase [Verrucomicrobiales bacterium]|nr:sulfatase-like hydrolase/transferase [Verrucomicrobiales bacterium]
MKLIKKLLLLLALVSPALAAAADRPNVVWIVSDDLGPELGCYGYPDVATPNLDRLAKEGTRFTNAFSTAPVCSASRTAFQTGLYQTTVGGHHHDTRDKKPLPDFVTTVTDLMHDAGYFVSNGRGGKEPEKKLAKSHLNWVYDAREFFDGNDWTQRKDGQPFFAQIQIKEPHRTFVTATKKYPNAPIPPYYPEHPVTTADWANYLASIEVLDEKVGAVLDRLDEEGFAENTLVLFFGDHGRPHVRGKQWLYDGGLLVPLIARWPGKVEEGKVDHRLVSLIDMMPTTLAAGGVEAPENLVGADLFDPAFGGHEKLFAARDRCGDAPDRIRSVRTFDFKYIRNFHPEIPYMQHSGYKRSVYPVDTLMRVLHEEGKWTSPFMAETRPEEELYDLKADPNEMNNLAADPEYAETLAGFRGDLDEWMVETKDLGAVDESLTVDLEKVMAEKWATYDRTMRKRGLSAEVSDREYLDWWIKELGVEGE